MNLADHLQELLEANVIDQETANRIRQHYRSQHAPSSSRLVTAFGIFGALLVGLGIILIIAHNWDNLSIVTKTVFAFIPLVIGQLLCAYTLLKKSEQASWREGAAVFLTLSVGAAISLISQIYHIEGSMSSFLMTWALLTIPIVYLMRSSMASLLYLIGISSYTASVGFGYPSTPAYGYWPLLALIIPYYYQLWKNNPNSNALNFHHWAVPISLTFALGTTAAEASTLYFMGYLGMFGVFALIGESQSLNRQHLFNSYKVIGTLGTLILLIVFSFWDFWLELQTDLLPMGELMIHSEFWVTLLIISIGTLLFIRLLQRKGIKDISPVSWAFLAVAPFYILGWVTPISSIFINILILGVGVFIAYRGAQKQELPTLNYGMLIIVTLITCRFFDTDISFIIRGILFMLVGIGFFAVNYWMLKQAKKGK